MSITEAFENEPVAIVGMGCRFSGTATSPEGLWNMLSKGTTGWSKNANDRFHLDAFWHPKADNKGSVSETRLQLPSVNLPETDSRVSLTLKGCISLSRI